MTFQEFDAQLEQTFTEMRLLGDDKGREYANNDQEDRLANFTRIARAYNVSATLVCAIYLEKHLDAIRSYVRLGKTLSEEKIEGRIRDAQLYLSLLEALISDLKVIDEPAQSTPELLELPEAELEPLIPGVLNGCWWLKNTDAEEATAEKQEHLESKRKS